MQIWNPVIDGTLFNWSIHLPVPAKIRYLLSLSLLYSWLLHDGEPRQKKKNNYIDKAINKLIMEDMMNDKNTFKDSLMKEGVILWAVFAKDGKATLRMDNKVHPENGKVGHGALLAPDFPVLYEILTPDDTFKFLSFSDSEYGVAMRIRIRLRYPGTDDTDIRQSEDEPEICFPAWIVRERTGKTSLYLQEPPIRTCDIPDMTGLPGLSELQRDGIPVRVELLIRKASPLLEYPEYSEEVKKKTDKKSDLMKEGIFVWIMFTSGEKAILYANDRIRFTEDGKYVPGKILSPDISAFHQVYDWDEQYPWICSTPGMAVRYRIRLRYPGTDDTGIEQSEYEPEACFPAWIVPQRGGKVCLYLQEPATSQCLIPDMTGLPGLPELKPDDAPVRVELLIRQSHWIFDMVDPVLLEISSYSKRLKPCLQKHLMFKK